MASHYYIPAPATPEEIAAAADPDALLSVRVVAALVGLHVRSLERRWRQGLFPPPVYLSPQLKRWRAGAVRQWLRDQAAMGNDSTSATGAGVDSTSLGVSSESR